MSSVCILKDKFTGLKRTCHVWHCLKDELKHLSTKYPAEINLSTIRLLSQEKDISFRAKTAQEDSKCISIKLF